MIDITVISNLWEPLKNIGSIIGVVGGLFGVYVFLDSHVFSFKPIFNISKSVLIKRDLKKDASNKINGVSISSISIRIEVYNARNKIGSIDNFAIRIYNPHSINPKTSILYSENELSRWPSDPIDFINMPKSRFCAISILGRSRVSIPIEFVPEFGGSVIVNLRNLKIDVLYKKDSRNWIHINSYSFFAVQDSENEVLQLSHGNYSDSIDLNKILGKPEVSIYRGATELVLNRLINLPYWFVIGKLNRIWLFVSKIVAIFQMLLRWIYDKTLIYFLLNRQSKRLHKVQISNPREHLGQPTKDELRIFEQILSKMIQSMNKDASKDALISMKVNQRNIEIYRSNMSLKIYQSGDGYLHISDTGKFPNLIDFSLELVEFPFGMHFWKVNGSYRSRWSICIKVLDSLVLVSH